MSCVAFQKFSSIVSNKFNVMILTLRKKIWEESYKAAQFSERKSRNTLAAVFVERCYLSSTTEHFRIKIEDLFGENISFQKKNLDIYKIRQRRIEGFATDKKDKQ